MNDFPEDGARGVSETAKLERAAHRLAPPATESASHRARVPWLASLVATDRLRRSLATDRSHSSLATEKKLAPRRELVSPRRAVLVRPSLEAAPLGPRARVD
jgi:hypothetical protein